MKVILTLDAPYHACLDEISDVLKSLHDKEFILVTLLVTAEESQAEKEVSE